MKTFMTVILTLVGAPLAAAGFGVTAAWRAAAAHDPTFAAAQAQRDAGLAHRSQARALWLPTLAATGSAARSDFDSRTQGAFFSAPGFGSTGGVDFRTSLNGGRATRWALVAEQPLFDAARFADASLQRTAAQIADLQYGAAQQALMTRTARIYFDVLDARAQLQALQRIHGAAETARAAAQARYEAGDIAVTDAREAQADADTVGVQELDARTALALSEAAFFDLTGLEAAQIEPMSPGATDDLPAPEPLETWTQRVVGGSPQLAISHLALASASAQLSRYGALNSPRLSLVAQLGRDSMHGTGDFGASDITQRQSTIGFQASIPLFTGGMRTAQRHEARAMERKAAAELDGAGQQVRQQARSAWLALTSAAARVRALQRLCASAMSRRDATRLGAEVGERTALELLGAEADYQRDKADFLRAQGDWFVAGLQLKAVAGELTESDLGPIDQRLGVAQAGPK
jgi:outer membrane protein